MSNPQSLDQIGPMQPQEPQQAKPERPSDPILAEFEDGKEFLAKMELAQAALAFHNVLLAHEEKEDEPGIANASNQLGHVCLAKEEFAQAEKHYKRAWDICEKNDDPMSMLSLNAQFVKVYRGLEDYKKAIKICLDLLDDYMNNNNQEGTVITLEELAEIFIATGEKGNAADAYRTIASIHKNFKHERIAESYLEKAAELS